MSTWKCQVQPDLQDKLPWPEAKWRQLAEQLLKYISSFDEESLTAVEFTLNKEGRSGVLVFKIDFNKVGSDLKYSLVVRHLPNQKAAELECQHAKELNSIDYFPRWLPQVPVSLLDQCFVVYEDVATNWVVSSTQALCKSADSYFSASEQEQHTFALNFKTFMTAVTCAYDSLELSRSVPGKKILEFLSKNPTTLEPDLMNYSIQGTWLEQPLRDMGFEDPSIIDMTSAQQLCATFNSVRLCSRHADLHCGNVLVGKHQFKVIDIGDLTDDLAASDLARLEVSLWFEWTPRFSEGEATTILHNLEPKLTPSQWQSSSPKALAFTNLLHHLRQGFREGIQLQDLPEEEIQLAYLLQILRYQRYYYKDNKSIPAALNVFVKTQFQFWQARLGRVPRELPKLRPCKTEEWAVLQQQLPQLLADSSSFPTTQNEVPRDQWPFPIQAALNRLRKGSPPIQDYFNAFEAFVHFHFAVLSSQFYWAITQDLVLSPEITAGLEALHAALSDASCQSSVAWVQRNARLSTATQALQTQSPNLVLPFAELTALPPAVDHWLSDLAAVRKQIDLCEKVEPPAELSPRLVDLIKRLRQIFHNYRHLHLAMVAEDDAKGRGIHGYWQETQFLSKTNPDNWDEMRKFWPESAPNRLQAPEPPRPEWSWDKSLILCDLQQPYQRYLYLMPWGAQYSHPKDDSTETRPGLLDSVRWKSRRQSINPHEERTVIIQRHYDEDTWRQLGWQAQLSDERAVQKQPVNQVVGKLVEELVDRYQFAEPEVLTEPPVATHSRFDLQHGRLWALPIASQTVPRPTQLQRILIELERAPTRRLLLEGASGSGKTVVLAQLYQQEHTRRKVVFIKAGNVEFSSTTQELERIGLKSENTGPKNSAALRSMMYCMTVLGAEPLQMELPLEQLRDKFRQQAQQQAEPWLLIIDGLNEALDPGCFTGNLPDPLPEHVYIVASSQPQDRVWTVLTGTDPQAWKRLELERLSQEEAHKIIQHYWQQPEEGQEVPAAHLLSPELQKQLWLKSQGLPVFLEGWIRRLREIWHTDPHHFAEQALPEFTQHADDWLPQFLRQKLHERQQQFQSPRLIETLLWSLSLIPKGLTLQELQECLRKLRDLPEFAALPPVSKSDIEDGLDKLGGFVHKIPGWEARWQLLHESVGSWFINHKGSPETLPKLRLSLVQFGAIPLPATATKEEFTQWLQWVTQEDHKHYDSLPPELQVSVCQSLLAHLPPSGTDYVIVQSKLIQTFLSGTGEQSRGFAVAWNRLGDVHQALKELEQAQQCFQQDFEISNQLHREAPTPQTARDLALAWSRLGDVHQALNELEQAQQCFQQYFEISNQLHREAPTPQTASDLATAWRQLGDVHQALNELEQAQQCFKQFLEILDQLHGDKPTFQTARDLAIAYNRLGSIYFAQEQFGQALPYFERSLQLAEQLLAAADIPKLRLEVEIAKGWVADTREKLLPPQLPPISLWEKLKRLWKK